MKDITLEDLRQKIENSLILHDKKPVYVTGVAGNFEIEFINLLDGKVDAKKFSEKFTAPTTRLGMVNYHSSVVYAERNPVRRFKLGIGKENTNIKKLKVNYPDRGFENYNYELMRMNVQEVGLTVIGKYPSFKQCCRLAQQEQGAFAFDRQFAVDSDGYVHYKTDKVGIVHKGKIVFAKGKEYLYNFLKADYDKGR